MSFFEAFLLGVIEGLTEFLPVSSTGHMMVGVWLLGVESNDFTHLFIVAIQSGAILSVVVLYWKRFVQSFRIYIMLLIAFIPAGVAGLLLHKQIDLLLSRVDVVGYALLVGGIFFLFVDRIFRVNEEKPETQVSYKSSFVIGCYQVLAMVPGVSRSAATIVGGLTQKLNKQRAAEFSFLLAVPTMAAATGYKLLEEIRGGLVLSSHQLSLLLVGNMVAFIVAMIAIRSFIRFLTNYGFRFFGFYRIVAGIIILLLFYLGSSLTVS